MEIEIKRLTPELADDYVHFFDITPHDQYVDAHKCYCVCWCADDYEGKDFSTVQKRRAAAYQYVQQGIIQGYLAYYNGKPVGWCNANIKADCLKCCSDRVSPPDCLLKLSATLKQTASMSSRHIRISAFKALPMISWGLPICMISMALKPLAKPAEKSLFARS